MTGSNRLMDLRHNCSLTARGLQRLTLGVQRKEKRLTFFATTPISHHSAWYMRGSQ